MAFVLHALTPNHCFLDVGANVGAYTVLASAVVGAKTISFEPVAGTVESLRNQLRINAISDRVTVMHCGVGAKKEWLRFVNDRDSTNKVAKDNSCANTEKVEIVSLDEAIAGPADRGKCILKIDVEGFEGEVLEGARVLLASSELEAIIIELNESGLEYGYSDNDLHEKITSYGFLAVDCDPFDRRLRVLESFNSVKKNTIYVRNVKEIQERLNQAPRRTIHTAYGRQI